jgi:hypothetical protein
MEPEGSSPNPQELSTCPYPDPDQSSPHQRMLPPSLISIFCRLGRLSKESVQVRGSCVFFITILLFTVRGC